MGIEWVLLVALCEGDICQIQREPFWPDRFERVEECLEQEANVRFFLGEPLTLCVPRPAPETEGE